MTPIEFVNKILAQRHHFPRFVNSLIDFTVDHPPALLLKWLSPTGKTIAPNEIPAQVKVPKGKSQRVVIAPVNYAGQGTLWARALEKGHPETWTYAYAIEVPGGFAFPTDTEIPLHVHSASRTWQIAQLHTVAKCTHVLVEAERSIFGRLFKDFEAEANSMREHGLDVAFLAHGTDIRVPTMHMGTSKWSIFHDKDFYWQREETLAKRNLAALRRMGGPFFVSTPDLLQFLPEAHWCPVMIDPSKWKAPLPAGAREVPVVAHVPSKAKLKGTPLIEPIMLKLQEEGLIEYRRVLGVPSEQMPQMYGEADIVLDQFRLGSYGVTACEAMGAGRIVLGHITDEVREFVKQEMDVELPIVEATPDTIEQVVRDLVADRARMAQIGAQGEAFVTKVHSGEASAQVLRKYWLDRQA